MGRTSFLPDQAELKQLVAQPVRPAWDWLVTTNTSLGEAGLKSQAMPGSPTFWEEWVVEPANPRRHQ